MKRMLFFTSLLVLAVMQAVAANVDLAMAQATAQRFIDRHDNGKRLSSAPADIRLLHAEANSSLTNVPVYYIFTPITVLSSWPVMTVPRKSWPMATAPWT